MGVPQPLGPGPAIVGGESYAEAKAALLATEDSFRSLAEEMPMIAWTATPLGEIDFVNRMLSDYTGLALDEPTAAAWQESIHPDDLDRCLIEWGHSISTREPYDIEYRIRRRDGEYRWFRVQVVPTRIAGGSVVKWYGTAIDIHKTKSLQEEATRSAQSLTTTLESITDAFMTLDKDWRFTYINAEAEKLLARPRADLLGRNLWEEFPAAESFGQEYRRAVDDRVAVSVEVYFEHIDTWMDVQAYPSRDGLVTHLRNITDKKRATLRLHEQTQQLLAAQRIGRMGTWDLDIFSGELVWSEATCGLFGISIEEFEGTLEHFLTFVAPEHRARLLDQIKVSKQDGRPLESEFRIKRSDGDMRWLYQRATIDGDPRKRLGMVMDVTDRHNAERELHTAYQELEHRVESRTAELAQTNEELQVAKNAAETANFAKSEFLSRMSHELRTPLNAILGFGQLLELSNLDPRRRECVGHMVKAGHHLLVLINDVLEISRVEIGEISLTFEPVDVGELLQDGCALMQTIAGDRRVVLTVKEFPVIMVKADRQKLRQVFLNLMSNGIKYNKEGGSLTISAVDKGNGYVAISFTDTGIGISKAGMTRLFTPFDRLGAGEQIEGAGLGLALSRSLAEAMGGRLTATSTEGKGSCFTVRMRRLAEPEESTEFNLPPWQDALPVQEEIKGRILVVEDNLTNLALFEQIFAPHKGVRLTVAGEGRLGLDLARAQRPDVILLDLHLPDISGKDVLCALKGDPSLAETPVIIVSADAFQNRSAELHAAGAFRYVTKPFDLQELTGAIVDALKLSPAT